MVKCAMKKIRPTSVSGWGGAGGRSSCMPKLKHAPSRAVEALRARGTNILERNLPFSDRGTCSPER